MSFLKKALLTVAVAAVGLAGTAVAPSPAQAVAAGSVEFVTGMQMGFGPVSMTSNTACHDSTGLGVCQISGNGWYNGSCGIGSGYIQGGLRASNGHVYSFNVDFSSAAVFQANGSFYNHSTGEGGPFVIHGASHAPMMSIAIDPCPSYFILTGTAVFGGV